MDKNVLFHISFTKPSYKTKLCQVILTRGHICIWGYGHYRGGTDTTFCVKDIMSEKCPVPLTKLVLYYGLL